MLLALDISTAQTGYAIGAKGKRPRWGVFQPGNMPREERIAFMAASVVQIVRLMGVTQVVAEAVSVGSHKKKDGTKGAGNLKVAIALAEAHGAIKHELITKFNLRMANLNLSTARKDLAIRIDLGVHGNVNKTHVWKWLTDKGYPTVNTDEQDALVIWLAVMMQKTGTTMDPTLKIQKDRLAPVKKLFESGQVYHRGFELVGKPQ